MIYCLMTSGTPLTKIMRDHLFTVAREMVANGTSKRAFRTDDFEGAVYTKGESANMGCISGVYFTAVIESAQISTKTKFIVPTGELEDLDKAKWHDVFPWQSDKPSLN